MAYLPYASELTAEQIAKAYAEAMKRPSAVGGTLSNPDTVRIAFAWLGWQHLQDKPMRVNKPLKHLIESWGGCYVDQNSVTAAAILLGLKGDYPRFGISGSLTFSPISALDDIASAFTHPHYMEKLEGVYGGNTYGKGYAQRLDTYLTYAHRIIAERKAEVSK